jgi:anti-anti-sigma factor
MGEHQAIRYAQNDGILTIWLDGEIDLATVGQLTAAFDQALASAPSKVVLDLSAVTFVDSTGIGAIVGLRNATITAGIALCLNPGPANVMRVMTLSGLTEAFDSPI